MTVFAPERPTTLELHEQHGLNGNPMPDAVERMRQLVSSVIEHPGTGLVVGVGPCSMTLPVEEMLRESALLKNVSEATPGLITLQRRNFWKPRTNPTDWHGPETTEPGEIFGKLLVGARTHGNGTAEVAKLRHVERYGRLLSLAWIGARNDDIEEQIDMAQYDPTLPFSIKNGLDGNIEKTLENIERIQSARGLHSAPVFLLYRGGDNARTPKDWAKEVRRAHELTGGKMLIDLAHGGEQAHAIDGSFTKSKIGQLLCGVHAAKLAAEGIRPAGYLMESSNAESLTDPNLPLNIGIKLVGHLANA
ncbi:MAG TPA: hypothetical protein VG604_03185 [Candidatus Saccharimonadales bacterium]|nr:hypothetical protein [Candidatus Saccharimonadales bacterium]